MSAVGVKAPTTIDYQSELILVNDNSVKENCPPAEIKPDTLGSLIGEKDMTSIQKLVAEEYRELYWIIDCESNFKPDVCSYGGCDEGMGLVQLIPSTVKYCEKKLGRKIDPFNVNDNLECGYWLIKNEGRSHWKQSKNCWSKHY